MLLRKLALAPGCWLSSKTAKRIAPEALVNPLCLLIILCVLQNFCEALRKPGEAQSQ